MAFGRNKNEMVFEEAIVKIGLVNNPESFGNGITGSPLDSFVGDDVGFIENGALTFSNAKEYIELLSRTPQQLIRKDVLRNSFTMSFNMQQFNASTLQLAYQALEEEGYANGSGIWDFTYLGTGVDKCNVTSFPCMVIIGQRTDCKPMGFMLFSSIIDTPDVSLNWSNNYLTLPVNATASPDERFPSTIDGEQRNLGIIWIEEQTP